MYYKVAEVGMKKIHMRLHISLINHVLVSWINTIFLCARIEWAENIRVEI